MVFPQSTMLVFKEQPNFNIKNIYSQNRKMKHILQISYIGITYFLTRYLMNEKCRIESPIQRGAAWNWNTSWQSICLISTWFVGNCFWPRGIDLLNESCGFSAFGRTHAWLDYALCTMHTMHYAHCALLDYALRTSHGLSMWECNTFPVTSVWQSHWFSFDRWELYQEMPVLKISSPKREGSSQHEMMGGG